MGLIAGFSSRKRKADNPLYIGPVTAANENNHENVHYMGIAFVMYTCVKMDAILPTIINNIKLLIIFFIFETSLDISPRLFISIVRMISHIYKSFLDCLSQLLTHTLWIIVMDGEDVTSKTKTFTSSQLVGLPLPTC